MAPIKLTVTVSTNTCPGSTTGGPRCEPIDTDVGDLMIRGDLGGDTTKPTVLSSPIGRGVPGTDLMEDLNDDPLIDAAMANL